MKVVLDWDGTVTERDTLDLLLSEFGRTLPEESASFREVMEREIYGQGSTSWPASTDR